LIDIYQTMPLQILTIKDFTKFLNSDKRYS
jgi:hypothetical protein